MRFEGSGVRRLRFRLVSCLKFRTAATNLDRLPRPPPLPASSAISPERKESLDVDSLSPRVCGVRPADDVRGRPGTQGPADQDPARQGPGLLVAQVDRRIRSRADCKTNDEKAIAILQLYAADALSPGPIPASRVGFLVPQGNQLLWLEPVRRPARGTRRPCGGRWATSGGYVGWSNPGHTTVEVNYDGQVALPGCLSRSSVTWMPDPNRAGRQDDRRRR